MATLATSCPGCASHNITITDRGQLAPFVAARTGVDPNLGRTCICNDCTLRFSQARWTQAEAEALYADYRGPTYNAERDTYEPGYSRDNAHLNAPRETLADIETWIGTEPQTVLDIGGNDGRNTPFADRATVWEIGQPQPTGRYDLAVLAHVLEHLAYPQHLLALAHTLAYSIYVEVPLDLEHDNWHEHCQQFNPRSLQTTLGPAAHIRTQWTQLGPVLQAKA